MPEHTKEYLGAVKRNNPSAKIDYYADEPDTSVWYDQQNGTTLGGAYNTSNNTMISDVGDWVHPGDSADPNQDIRRNSVVTSLYHEGFHTVDKLPSRPLTPDERYAAEVRAQMAVARGLDEAGIPIGRTEDRGNELGAYPNSVGGGNPQMDKKLTDGITGMAKSYDNIPPGIKITERDNNGNLNIRDHSIDPHLFNGISPDEFQPRFNRNWPLPSPTPVGD